MLSAGAEAIEILERAQVGRAPDLGEVGQAEDEVAEPEAVDHEAAQLLQQERRLLEQERRAHRLGERLVGRQARLQRHRHVRMRLADAPREGDARLRRHAAVHRELDVGDDAEHVLLVGGKPGPRLLERLAQQDLRAGLDPHQPVREVHALRRELLGVVHQLGVDHRQERRVVADVVLDDDHHLHAHQRRVIGHVEPVLDLLDDGEEDRDVALPEVDALEIGGVVAVQEQRQLPRVVGEQHDRDGQARLLHLPRQRGRVHVPDVHRGDDQVEAALPRRERQRLGARRDAGDGRAVAEAQVEELAEDPLAELAVLRQDERVVQAADEQDVLDPVLGEILEAAEAAGERRAGIGWADGHHGGCEREHGKVRRRGRHARAAGDFRGL